MTRDINRKYREVLKALRLDAVTQKLSKNRERLKD